MSNRAVVCVATTPAYQKGMRRLESALRDGDASEFYTRIQEGWPTHEAIPYGFKAFALKRAVENGYDTLLWCDACMLPVQNMTSLWERIERDGYWFSRNGFSNYDWTADSAYPDLFPHLTLDEARPLNRNIQHVVATCFGISLKTIIGREFLRMYYELASETNAFCGPWINANNVDPLLWKHDRVGMCGPPDVRGHRHDQTAASVIAYRLGMQLTNPPEIFAYGKQGERFDPHTIMIADGGY